MCQAPFILCAVHMRVNRQVISLLSLHSHSSRQHGQMKTMQGGDKDDEKK